MSYSFFVKRVTVGGKTLYPDTNLIIKERGITVIVGSNGCGKTTLINQILYTNPESVLLIAQENDLIFDNRSIEENIILFEGDSKYLHELLRSLDMEYILTRKPAQLSGGEKRIISLLRLFFVDRNIVILDEPTNDLDYRCVDIIKQIILDLSKQKSVLIVTHDDRITELAEIKYYFSEGKILTDHSPEEPVAPLPHKEIREKIRKTVKRDAVGILLFLLIIVSLLGAELSYFVFKPRQIDHIMEGQTNLAVKQYGYVKTMLDNGYLPLKIYLEYNGSVDMDFLQSYSDILNESILNGTSQNMFIGDDYGEDVYLGVFWDPKTNEKTFPLRDYQSLYEMKNGEKVDLSEYLSVFDGISEIADSYPDSVSGTVDKELYQKMEDAYFSVYPNLQPLLYVILGENIQKLETADENWFIKNNMTVEICNQINTLANLNKFIIITALCLASSIGIFILYFLINLKLLRKQIVVFRNFGIPSENVLEELFRSKCTPKEKALILFPCLLMNLILFYIGSDKMIFGFIAVLSIVVYFSVVLISRKILSKSIHSIYSFGDIYED